MRNWEFYGNYTVNKDFGWDVYRTEKADAWGVKPWSSDEDAFDDGIIREVEFDEEHQSLIWDNWNISLENVIIYN